MKDLTFKCENVSSKKESFLLIIFSIGLIVIGLIMINSLFSLYSDLHSQESDALLFTNFMPFIHLLATAWVAGACLFIALYISVKGFLTFNISPLESICILKTEKIEIKTGSISHSIAYRNIKSIDKVKPRSNEIQLSLKGNGESIFLDLPIEREKFLNLFQEHIDNVAS